MRENRFRAWEALRMGGRGRAGLLLSSSVAALLIGGGAPAAVAQCYTGPFPFSNSGPLTCITVSGTTFSGNVVNSTTGVITPGSPNGILVTNSSAITGQVSNAGKILIVGSGTGIRVDNNSIITNGIVNTGTISANIGILVGSATLVPNVVTPTGIVTFPATIAGGITNSGTIAAGSAGIWVQAADRFSGGIVNSASGTIFGQVGIRVGVGATTSGIVKAVSSFGGGIVNNGLIQVSGAGTAVAGIVLDGVSTFTGGIRNSGQILNPNSTGTGITVNAVESFSGGIVNSGSGTISGFAAGIAVCGCVTTFLDGIVNAGLIAAGSSGISVGGVSVFRGGILNSGTISVTGGFAGVGIAVLGVATFTDGITNTGLISAAGAVFSAGIQVNFVDQFSGGIENGSTGIIAVTPGLAPSPIGIQVFAVTSFNGDIVNRGLIQIASPTPTGIGIQVRDVQTFTGNIINAGTIMAGFKGIEVSGSTSFGVGQMMFTGGITNAGLISIASASGGSIGISIDGVSVFLGGIRNSGTITGAGIGIDICSCVVTFAGGLTNTGLIAANTGGVVMSATSFFGNLSNSGTITVSGSNPTNAAIVVVGTTFVDGHIVNTGTIAGPTAIDLFGAGNAITIEQNAGLITGDILLSSHGDTLFVRGGTINGNIFGQSAGETINFSLGAGTFTYAAAYGFTSINQVNVNSGIVILNGANDAANVAVNGGVLQVGDELNTLATLTSTVDVIGGTLSGHGTIAGDVTIENGGILFPGGSIGTLTITNTLTFNGPGGIYAVQITPTANSSTAVLGSVSISNNTVVVIPQLGHYNATTYAIMTAGGGTTGSFATTPTFTAPFAFTGTASVVTDPNEADLVLGDGYVLLAPPGTNQNQQAVVNGINGFILGTGANPPPQFANLATLSGPALLNALSQLSGENHAGFLQGAFQAGNSFLTLLVNPFLDGRFGPGGGFAAAMGFAAEEPPAMPEAALAFAKAMPTKAPPLGIATSASAAYRVWGSAYGGAETVDGNAAVGSQRTTSRAFGFAAGVDYPIAPMTTVGFALAGGGTSWGLDGGLGSGHSDVFQAGLHGSHRWGPAYVSAALAYNFHDVTTDRTVTVAGADRLTAGFQAHGIGARLEGGYRYATPWLGITPYGAVQVQSIFLPAYGETATAGSNQFALNFASQTATATRTELGAWLDKSTLLADGAVATLYGRVAWAHDFGNTRAVSAIFQGLPGSNFVVNGAAPAPDSALITAGALYRLMNGWSFQAKFDGEFSSTTNVYSGTGAVKKTW
jgi:uncharacterized protein with beta-barrel porin domain